MTARTTEDVLALAAMIGDAVAGGAVARMTVPPRQRIVDERGTKYISMPAVSPDHRLYVNKTATITRGPGTTVTSVVPVFSAETGGLLAVLDGAEVTDLKCAAVSALVTGRCAAPDAATLAIVGAGVQAWQQYRAVTAVREIGRVRIFSRTRRNAEAFGARIRAAGRAEVTVCGSAAEATAGADIVATATTSAEPLPISTELPAHAHVNCMGAHTPDSRELTRELLESSLLVVESRDIAIAEAGEIHRSALDLAALLDADPAGLARRTTVFSSTGHASLDLITCAYLIDH
ncbi:ornithine cyclodeaminase family protein [Actinomadura sp. 9N215]|uniref:ornithine cyclodeaminase family protein n=1 Tax=Actinomadura sp. 9N215 TaxID=3375150 RepID=UPI0037A5280B